MRKYLMIILTLILIILMYITVTKGVQIGDFRILSWNDLVNNNNDLDNKINGLNVLMTVTFPKNQSELSESFKQLNIKKDEYANLVLYSSEEELASATQTEIYETEYLWTKLGNYATKNNGIDMKIDVLSGTSGVKDQYNLNFTLVGQYAYISDFISSVENDSKLGFRIERFSMVPAENIENEDNEENKTNLLQAKFTIENVGINIKNA